MNRVAGRSAIRGWVAEANEINGSSPTQYIYYSGQKGGVEQVEQ